VRRGLTAAGAALLVACASAAPPPGGAEDHAPPRLVRVTPDTNAVNVADKVVSFYFDETINDRGSGATELSNYFLVSPSDGNARVSWHRSRIDVRPRLGFRPNTAYTVSMLPGLSDLRANVSKQGVAVVFSTGPAIPANRITGVAFDWAAERPAARALVQAVTLDSLTYLAQTDSGGRFTLGPMPAGTYLVRAVLDANNNRALDRNEAYDSVRVTVPVAAPLELLALVRDTLPAHITGVTVMDSLSLRVSFDRPLDPATVPGVNAFRLVGPDSVPVAIRALVTPRQESDSIRIATTARADSARRADSVAGRAVPVPARPPVGARGASTASTARPAIPAPPASLLLRIARPLPPATLYRLQVTGARSLSGRVATSERTFSTPAAVRTTPADSTRRPVVTPNVTPAARPVVRPTPPAR
jgi:hypothetical protein